MYGKSLGRIFLPLCLTPKSKNMKKGNLKDILNITLGELKADIDSEDGRFDETVYSVLLLVFCCDELLEKDSDDTMIQLDKSVWDEEISVYIDAIILSLGRYIHFSTSSKDNGSIYTMSIIDIPRESILKAITQIYKMLWRTK